MIVVGIDEVGRGCWAGPLVAGAVVLKEPIVGLKDSKLLSKKRREELDVIIRDQAVSVGLGWVDAPTIDQIGLTAAVALAMSRALEQITVDYDEVIIDGNLNYLPDNPKTRALIKADMTEPSVSAGSIVAKVARDNFMIGSIEKYPYYGFEQHVGYGTAMHLQRLRVLGVCDLHRKSFKPVQMVLALA